MPSRFSLSYRDIVRAKRSRLIASILRDLLGALILAVAILSPFILASSL